jgi:hypothetical protein
LTVRFLAFSAPTVSANVRRLFYIGVGRSSLREGLNRKVQLHPIMTSSPVAPLRPLRLCVKSQVSSNRSIPTPATRGGKKFSQEKAELAEEPQSVPDLKGVSSEYLQTFARAGQKNVLSKGGKEAAKVYNSRTDTFPKVR